MKSKGCAKVNGRASWRSLRERWYQPLFQAAIGCPLITPRSLAESSRLSDNPSFGSTRLCNEALLSIPDKGGII